VARIRIAACQINTFVGDLDGNANRILEALGQAEAAGADVAVFPELAITGYPPEDLVLRPEFVRDNLEALEELGYVTHTHFDDRVTRWHRADAQRHGHLVCRSCGAEQEVPIGLLEPLARRLRDEHGFRADLAHSAIVGICKACANVSSE